MAEEKALRQGGRRGTYPGSDSFYLPTQNFLSCSQQPWHLRSPAGKARYPGAVAVGTRDVASFKRPSERGKGKVSKPKTS